MALYLGSQLLDSALETYSMPMLDTIYVRKDKRRRGFAERMMQDFIASHPSTDLGISEPISKSMLKGIVICMHTLFFRSQTGLNLSL